MATVRPNPPEIVRAPVVPPRSESFTRLATPGRSLSADALRFHAGLRAATQHFSTFQDGGRGLFHDASLARRHLLEAFGLFGGADAVRGSGISLPQLRAGAGGRRSQAPQSRHRTDGVDDCTGPQAGGDARRPRA